MVLSASDNYFSYLSFVLETTTHILRDCVIFYNIKEHPKIKEKKISC